MNEYKLSLMNNIILISIYNMLGFIALITPLLLFCIIGDLDYFASVAVLIVGSIIWWFTWARRCDKIRKELEIEYKL